jgi:ketosteroid isomerase-like protein
MQRSTDIEDAFIAFCERLSAGDVDSFDDYVAPDAVAIIGTAPGERVEERERMRFGFETEGVRLEPDRPEGYAEGTMGWVLDEPIFFLPEGSSFRTRVTFVMREDAGRWKLVHGHFSVGVPDEEVVELQERWSG